MPHPTILDYFSIIIFDFPIISIRKYKWATTQIVVELFGIVVFKRAKWTFIK